jgi:hypothetical protein
VVKNRDFGPLFIEKGTFLGTLLDAKWTPKLSFKKAFERKGSETTANDA